MKESELERLCINYLKVVTLNNRNIAWFKIKAGAQLHTRGGHVHRKPSTIPGFPDLLLCVYGYFVTIELKTLIGKQSENQKVCQEYITGAWGKYFIVRTLDSFIELINLLLKK